jgi:TetR/AcrR family transcriptional regulator, transcriptional repressor for nem operon
MAAFFLPSDRPSPKTSGRVSVLSPSQISLGLDREKTLNRYLLVGSLIDMQGETADRILETAKALISDLGYSGFSYADISETVQISKASIHHHFPTKANLVVSVLRGHREKLIQGTQSLTEQVDNPLARLRAYVQHWEGCIRGNKEPFCIAALLAAELPSLPEEVRFEVQQHFLDLSGWIRKTLEEGVRKRKLKLQGNPEDEAQTFMALVHGAMLSARALGNPDVFETITTSALQRISTRRA